MMRVPLRIATTKQLERSVREGGYEAFVLPETGDFNRSLQQRCQDGPSQREFLEKHRIDLVLDFNTEALTLVDAPGDPGKLAVTAASLGIPHVACYLDPIASTMAGVNWADHWQLLESPSWIKWIWETAHADELKKLRIPNIVTMPMAAANDDFNTDPVPEPVDGPLVAFMGHPASSWFRSNQPVLPSQLFAGLTAAAVHADMPDMPFHKIYYDLYQFSEPPRDNDPPATRAAKSAEYYNQKFLYNAYLAVKQRDRFARFLKTKLGDAFELVGDHWQTNYGLAHTPRIWDMQVLHERMRRVPICLNLMKGNLETGLNVRHFEITAYGGFMLTYHTPELDQCFKVGEECDSFRDESELLEKIGFYAGNSKRRREVAAAGQRRTLLEHLYSHRIQTLVELLRGAGVLSALQPSAKDQPAKPPLRQSETSSVTHEAATST